MAQDDGANTPVNLLALGIYSSHGCRFFSPACLYSADGGGIRGVSELVILHEIMLRVKWDLELEELPLPCDYFHLIGGTSTGG
jgi:hypothetical protein